MKKMRVADSRRRLIALLTVCIKIIVVADRHFAFIANFELDSKTCLFC